MDARKPEHEIRRGRIRASIWVDDTDGEPRARVRFSRLCRVSGGWLDSRYFRVEDLDAITELAADVKSWLSEREGRTPIGG